MNLHDLIYKDMNTSEIGCLLVHSDPKEYGFGVDNLILPKNKRKSEMGCEYIVHNFFSLFTEFDSLVNLLKYEDNEEKEIVLEKPMYFLNVLGLNDYSLTKKKIQLHNKNIKSSKDITEYFEKNYNIYSTEYIDSQTKQSVMKIIFNCLYVENKNQNKKQIIYPIDNFYDFYQKNVPGDLMDWCATYTPNQNPFQLKYVIKCDTITKNFLFVVGLDKNILFDNVHHYFSYLRNKIKEYMSLTNVFKDLLSQNKNILLDIKNLNINNQQFIEDTIYLNEKYYYCKYNPILNDDPSISMSNSIKCVSSIIYLQRQIIRNMYFIALFTKYLEYFIKNFYGVVKIYNVNHIDDIKEIDIQSLYENYYKKIFNYTYNLFLYDKTMFNYDKEMKDVLENISNKYNMI